LRNSEQEAVAGPERAITDFHHGLLGTLSTAEAHGMGDDDFSSVIRLLNRK
jgi:hypothetical protein